ncbi:MAG: PAS domain S-box protein [Lentisphaeria bacterium]|jgi:PAS domain S-box-containing protein|nr:PAS domain S-box protein [Lentisphaeria bacterium]
MTQPALRSLARRVLLALALALALAAAPLPGDEEKDSTKAEQMLASILKTVPTGIGVVEDRMFSQVNDYILNLTGYTREELIGQSARMLYPSDEEYEFVGREKYRQIGEKGTGSVVTRWQTKDGSIRHVLLSSAPLDPDNLAAGVTFTVLDISERVQAENALRESEERFFRIFQSSPAPLVVSEIATGEFIDVNESWIKMFGYTREEHIGHTSKELGIWSDPRDRDRIVASLSDMGFFRNEPIHFKTKSGGDRYALWSGEVITLGGRQVLLSLILDETERRQAEMALAARTRTFQIAQAGFAVVLLGLVVWLAALLRQRQTAAAAIQESSNLLQIVLDTIPVRVFWKDLDLRYLGCNKLFAEDAGKASPAELTGLDDYAMAWREEAERYRSDDRSVLAADRPKLDYEEPLPTAAGRRICLRISKLPLRNAGGKVIGMLGVYDDITDRKRAEDALRESERRFQSFMDETPVYAYIKDDTLSHIYQNQRISELEHTVVHTGGRDSSRNLFGPETAELLEQADRQILDGKTDRIELEYCVDIGGKPCWLADVKFLLRLQDGRKAVGGMAFDITERKTMEAEREKLWSQLMQAQKMESLGRLAGGVAHDFNNMLQAILGYTELGISQLEPDHPIHADLSEIQSAAGRAADLTRQLLAFARKQTVAPKVLDLNTAVAETMGMLQRLIGEDISLAWLPSRGLWPVKVDPTQVGMVLTNLCVNARDAIAGHGQITIETGNVTIDAIPGSGHANGRAGDFVVLTVTDDGCGMDQETLAKIFEPFFTTKGMGKGTGLGLASIHGIAEQNGGFIHAYSELGKGSTFRFYLPRHRGEQTPPDPDCGRAAPALPGGTETILVAEDESLILSICRAVLTKLGYQVLAARTPGEAITLCQLHPGPIHLLLTDVVMPEMNGRKLAAEIGRLRPDVPCVYMSGYAAGAIAQHGMLEEGLDFLQKPFSNRALAEKIREVLDRAAAPPPEG